MSWPPIFNRGRCPWRICARISISKRTIGAAAAGLLALSTAAAPSAAGDDYPARYIRIIAPFAAGGLTDIALRPLAAELAKSLGQPVIVENRTGASGLVAARACAGAAPDGYTICLLHNDAVLNAPFLFRSVGYDPARDFVPITNNYFNTAAFVVNASSNVKSLADLIAFSKARPEGATLASLSTMITMFVEAFNARTGAVLRCVPYRGGGEATTAVIAGTVDATFAGIGNLLPHIASGKLRVLAVEGAQRAGALPDVPTINEAGFNVERVRNWFGFFALAATSPAIVAKLHAAIIAAYRDPEFTARTLLAAGLEPVLDTPAAFARFLELDRARTEDAFKRSGTQPE